MQTIFGLFTDFTAADAAVEELQKQEGITENINVLVHAQLAQSYLDEVNQARVPVNATDAVGEQTLSGLALQVLKEQPVEVRGLGKVYAAGQMATILANTTVTTNQTGETVQSMLVSYGVADKTAEHYQSTISQGGILIWVRSDDQQVGSVSTILQRHQAQQITTN